MQLRKAVGACVLGVALSVGSVQAASETGNILTQQCLTLVGFYRGPLTGVMDEPSKQAFLAYVVARKGRAAMNAAARQGIEAMKALGEAAALQLVDECVPPEETR